MEAASGIEPEIKVLQTSALPLGYAAIWSGKRDSNPRPQPWQGCALPLSYFRTWRPGSDLNWRSPPWQGGMLDHYTTGPFWWAMTGSNCRHSACKADALPAELIAHIRISLLCLISLFFSSALRCLSPPSCHLFKNIINRLDKSYYVRLYSC